MRFMSGICILGVSLVLGLTACSKKEDANKDQPSAVSSVQVAPQQTAPVAAGQSQVQPNMQPQGDEVTTRIIVVKPEHEISNDYVCKNGTRFNAVFTRNPDAVLITFPGRVTVKIPQKHMEGIGFVYEGPQYTLRGRGTQAKWIMTGRDPVDCSIKTYADLSE